MGEVHIGIVHLIELEEPLVWPREAAIDEAGFAPIRDLLRRRDEFETWSQFVLEEMVRGDSAEAQSGNARTFRCPLCALCASCG